MAWLPNGDMLFTDRDGELRLVKQELIAENKGIGKISEKIVKKIEGLPKIKLGGQGGLLDIAVHPDYANNGWLYFSYTKADDKGNKSTAIMRAKLHNMTLTSLEDIYIAQAYGSKGVHFGIIFNFL